MSECLAINSRCSVKYTEGRCGFGECRYRSAFPGELNLGIITDPATAPSGATMPIDVIETLQVYVSSLSRRYRSLQLGMDVVFDTGVAARNGITN